MAVVVVVESGLGTNSAANSLSSVAEINAHAEAHLYLTAWEAEEDEDQKNRAAVLATRLLARHVPWAGYPAVTDQPLPWPRTGCVDRNGNVIPSNVVPALVKEAHAELANAILAEDRTADPEKGLSSLKVDVIQLNFDKWDRKGVLPREVMAALAPVARWGSRLSIPLVRG
jgi:hypothetical protein